MPPTSSDGMLLKSVASRPTPPPKVGGLVYPIVFSLDVADGGISSRSSRLGTIEFDLLPVAGGLITSVSRDELVPDAAKAVGACC